MAKGSARIIINMGPGSGKSELCSVHVPLWLFANDPSHKIISASGTPELPVKFGGAVKDALKNPLYNTKVRADSDAKAWFQTTAGGQMKATTIMGGSIGFRANTFLIDDPYGKMAQARSRAYRLATEEFYTYVAASRLEPDGNVIVIHHRMHPLDLTDFLLKGPGGSVWEHISLPSIATGPDVLGRAKGEALCPDRYDIPKLEAIRLEMRYAFEPMHQQDPGSLVSGRLYTSFAPENESPIELAAGHDVDLCVDFNINPGMHFLVGQHFKGDDSFRYTHEIHGPRMNLVQAAAEFVKLWRTLPWKPTVRLFGDASGGAANVADGRSNWSILTNTLKAAGINTRNLVPFANPGIIDSVNSLNEALCDSVTGARRMKVSPRCERLLVDLREVQADEDGKPDKTDGELTHASDAARYHVHFLSPVKTYRAERPKGRVG